MVGGGVSVPRERFWIAEQCEREAILNIHVRACVRSVEFLEPAQRFACIAYISESRAYARYFLLDSGANRGIETNVSLSWVLTSQAIELGRRPQPRYFGCPISSSAGDIRLSLQPLGFRDIRGMYVCMYVRNSGRLCLAYTRVIGVTRGISVVPVNVVVRLKDNRDDVWNSPTQLLSTIVPRNFRYQTKPRDRSEMIESLYTRGAT